MPSTSVAIIVVVEELNDENAAYGAIQNFIDICADHVDQITIIGPQSIDIDRNDVRRIPVSRPVSSHVPSPVGYLRYQMRIAKTLLRERDHLDHVFFHVGGSLLLFPMLLCQYAAIRSSVFITGSIEKGFYAQNGHGLVSKLFARSIKFVESITCTLADDMLLLAESMDAPAIRWPSSTTTRVANFNYIDCDRFTKQVPIANRPIDVIFVGRFESVKGIQNLVATLPGLIERHPDIRIRLLGSGEQREEVERFVEREGISNHVTFTGWVDREEIPGHLNDARLLLMPSISEGVPKAILEAMACGTVPIATPVGGIPDLIDDGMNGFLLQDSNPKEIERTVLRALRRDDLNDISNNAREYVQDNHSYQTVNSIYRSILNHR